MRLGRKPEPACNLAGLSRKGSKLGCICGGLSLDAGRYFIGGRTSLGGFETHWDEHTQQGILYTGTKEELQKYTIDLILNHGKIGLMLGGDCTIDAKLDWERIRWIIEAARSI